MAKKTISLGLRGYDMHCSAPNHVELDLHLFVPRDQQDKIDKIAAMVEAWQTAGIVEIILGAPSPDVN